MAIKPPPLRSPIVQSKYVDSKGEDHEIYGLATAEWQRSLAQLYEEVRRIAVARQKTLIHSWDEVIAPIEVVSGWPSADLAFFVPFTVYEKITIKRVLVPIGTVNGENADFGIYDLDGTRKVSTGSVSLGTSDNQVRAFDIVDTALNPGRYYMAMSIDTAGVTFPNSGGGNQRNLTSGVKEQDPAFPLPATATMADSALRDYIPVFVLSSEA